MNHDQHVAGIAIEGDGCSCACSECKLSAEEKKDCDHYRNPVNEIDDRRDV